MWGVMVQCPFLSDFSFIYHYWETAVDIWIYSIRYYSLIGDDER